MQIALYRILICLRLDAFVFFAILLHVHMCEARPTLNALSIVMHKLL